MNYLQTKCIYSLQLTVFHLTDVGCKDALRLPG